MTYLSLFNSLQVQLESNSQSRANTPPLWGIRHPRSRGRSNTNPLPSRLDMRQLSSSFHSIDRKYQVAWECADLLIDLGSGATLGSLENESRVEPPRSRHGTQVCRGRERAITLAGDEGKPNFSDLVYATRPPRAEGPPLLHWRASTGRHDLNQRQLVLLREMLGNPSSTEGPKSDLSARPATPHWRTGEAMESSVTLSTERSISTQDVSSTKRSSSRLRMVGIRDMLRSLKRHSTKNIQPVAVQSSTMLSAESSTDVHLHEPKDVSHATPKTTGRRRSKTSSGPVTESLSLIEHPKNSYANTSGKTVIHRSSPRRPSLASLFRLGQRFQQKPPAIDPAQSSDKRSHAGVQERLILERSAGVTCGDVNDGQDDNESDWDRMDSRSDMDVILLDTNHVQVEECISSGSGLPGDSAGDGMGSTFSNYLGTETKDYLLTSVQTSPYASTTKSHYFSRFSSVNQCSVSPAVSTGEQSKQIPKSPLTKFSARRPRSPNISERDRAFALTHLAPLPDSKGLRYVENLPTVKGEEFLTTVKSPIIEYDHKLAMTPENILPLLENARVVKSRLIACLAEARALIDVSDVEINDSHIFAE